MRINRSTVMVVGLASGAALVAGCGASRPPAMPPSGSAVARSTEESPPRGEGRGQGEVAAPARAPAESRPTDPSEAAFGFPRRDLRVVAYNVHWDLEGVDRVTAAVKPLDPDVLFMEEVMGKDLEEIGAKLGMTSAGKVQVFYSPRPPEGTSGTAIFSRFPLSGGRFILPSPEPGEREGHGDWGHGAWAEVTVDARRVALACVHLTPTQGISPGHLRDREQRRGREIAALLDLWHERGSPPAIFGGDFNQLPAGGNYHALAQSLTDALASLGKTDWTCEFGPLRTRIDYLWLSPGWQPLDGAVVDSDASDHRPIWVRARGG